MEKEIWKNVVGYEGLYEISSLGRVKRLSRVKKDSMGRKTLLKEKILKNGIAKQTGYPSVNLSNNGIAKTFCIHKLIADAFLPNPNNLPCVNHIDEDRSNSVLSNLERCTYAYNNSYGNARAKRRNSLRKYYERNSIPMKSLNKDVILSVTQYTLEGDIISFFKGGYPEIREKLGLGSSVLSCLCHKTNSAYGYVWRYDGDDFSYTKRRTNKGRKFPNVKHSHQKYVVKIDGNGNEIERYKSVSDAGKKNGFDRHYFSTTEDIDGIKTIKGMRFIVEKKENEYIPKGHKGARPDLKGKGAKAVCQYDKNAVFIREFSSIVDAAEFLGNKKYGPEITNCCKGNLKTARGFLWTYKGGKTPQPFIDCSRKVIDQYSLEGLFIARYKSINEAIEKIGRGVSTCIGNNLAGRSHSAYGYIWKYAN